MGFLPRIQAPSSFKVPHNSQVKKDAEKKYSEPDKQGHYRAGYGIGYVGSAFGPAAVPLVVGIAAGKELYDGITGTGHMEFKDFAATVDGGLHGIAGAGKDVGKAAVSVVTSTVKGLESAGKAAEKGLENAAHGVTSAAKTVGMKLKFW